MAAPRRGAAAPLKGSVGSEQAVPDEAQLADLAAKRKIAEGNIRAREQAKEDVARRNEQAHKEAVTKLARRRRLREDMVKGLEF